MTLPSSGPLSLQAINAEFSLGTNLQSYQGVTWYTNSAGTGTFSSGALSMNAFYGKRKTSPVTPGSQTISATGNTNFTVPTYSSMTITIYGAAGGGGGASGNTSSGGPGSDGTVSKFGSYGTGDYGRGGLSNGTSGANGTGYNAGDPNDPAGGAGGGNNGAPTANNGGPGGGGGTTTITLTNPINGGNGPSIGATVVVTVGTGGAGGYAGSCVVFNGFAYVPVSINAGSQGSNGLVKISWS